MPAACITETCEDSEGVRAAHHTRHGDPSTDGLIRPSLHVLFLLCAPSAVCASSRSFIADPKSSTSQTWPLPLSFTSAQSLLAPLPYARSAEPAPCRAAGQRHRVVAGRLAGAGLANWLLAVSRRLVDHCSRSAPRMPVWDGLDANLICVIFAQSSTKKGLRHSRGAGGSISGRGGRAETEGARWRCVCLEARDDRNNGGHQIELKPVKED